MESLLMDGFSISLKDLDGRSAMQKANQSSSLEIDKFSKSTVDFIANSSALGLLVDCRKMNLGAISHTLNGRGAPIL
jgi:DNA-directed RNA polymerase-5 subunit 1